jgi:hypothetical protein
MTSFYFLMTTEGNVGRNYIRLDEPIVYSEAYGNLRHYRILVCGAKLGALPRPLDPCTVVTAGGKSIAKLEVCVGVWQFTTALRKFL